MSVERLKDPIATPQEFMFNTERLRQHDIYPLRIDAFDVAALNEARLGTFDEILPEDEGLYLMHDDFLKRSSEGSLPNRLSFSLQSGLSVGREDSRNNVFFGQLTYHHFDQHTVDEEVSIAVKPFKGSAKKSNLGQEIGMLTKLKELRIDSPEIIGLLKDKDSYYLLTEFRSDVLSLDSLDWRGLAAETKISVIDRGIKNLLEIHRHGIFHGDAHPRNLTIQPNLNAVWHVDFEHSVLAKSAQSILLSLKSDLRAFYSGLCGLTGMKQSYENMVEMLLEPYERSLLQFRGSQTSNTEVLDKITLLFPLLCEEFEREFAGEPINAYERQFKLQSLDVGHVAINKSLSKSA